MKFNIAVRLLTLIATALPNITYAQVCPPVGVLYVVRAEDGTPLTRPELESIAKELPKTIGVASPTTGAATVTISSVPANDDGSLRPYPYFGEKAPKAIPALSLLNHYPCRLRVDAVTLMFHEKTMRLIFDLEFDARGVNILVIDSPPFQEGTFVLDPPSAQTVIPAHQWKKVNDPVRPSAPQ